MRLKLRLYRKTPLNSVNKASAILAIAQECARKLTCKFCTHWEQGKGEKTSLFSLGSNCPYEYLDLGGGVMDGRRFKVVAKQVDL